jgi:hypothetical protein
MALHYKTDESKQKTGKIAKTMAERSIIKSRIQYQIKIKI